MCKICTHLGDTFVQATYICTHSLTKGFSSKQGYNAIFFNTIILVLLLVSSIRKGNCYIYILYLHVKRRQIYYKH